MNDANERIRYSKDWQLSAEHFYSNNAYEWMAGNISEYTFILELGSGTGQSTVSLLENNHKVICIEKNEYCIRKAKKTIRSNGYSYSDNIDKYDEVDVIILNIDICDLDVSQHPVFKDIDVVICWNVGTHWSKEMLSRYSPEMQRYGLTVSQIMENYSSSYAEFIIWKALGLGSELDVPTHLIDRNPYNLDIYSDSYFIDLKEEFDYTEIVFNSLESTSLSGGGRQLVTPLGEESDEMIRLFLQSLLFV